MPEITEGHYLSLGRATDLWSAIGPDIAVVISNTRQSLSDLLAQACGRECFFVENKKHGSAIYKVIDQTHYEETDCVIVFNRVKNHWNVVSKMWFDAEKPPDETNVRAGSLEVTSPGVSLGRSPEPAVVLSDSLTLEVERKA